MKQVLFIFLIATTIFIACEKSTENKSQNSSTAEWIYVNSCKTINPNIKICFDSLLNESRCPTGAVCVWEGYALARFKVTIGSQMHTIKLATTIVNNKKMDTTVNSYKIMLDSITPYPDIQLVYQYKSYKAKLIVTN